MVGPSNKNRPCFKRRFPCICSIFPLFLFPSLFLPIQPLYSYQPFDISFMLSTSYIPSSPAPSYQPGYSSSTTFRNNGPLLQLPVTHLSTPVVPLRRVASAPDTTLLNQSTSQSTPPPHASTNNVTTTSPVLSTSTSTRTSSYSVQRQKVKVNPSHFRKIRLLGKGDVGRVYLVEENETKQLYAMKGNAVASTEDLIHSHMPV